jgi:hypothetical protein
MRVSVVNCRLFHKHALWWRLEGQTDAMGNVTMACYPSKASRRIIEIGFDAGRLRIWPGGHCNAAVLNKYEMDERLIYTQL